MQTANNVAVRWRQRSKCCIRNSFATSTVSSKRTFADFYMKTYAPLEWFVNTVEGRTACKIAMRNDVLPQFLDYNVACKSHFQLD